MTAVHVHIHRRTRDAELGPPEPERKGKPLYASMRLSRHTEERMAAWAADQGFALAYSPHVTVAYSKQPVSPDGVPRLSAGMVVPPGGRSVERFGDAAVLCVDCPELQRRWQEYRDAGASWDYPTYRPHVTLSYRGDVPSDLEPFDEPLVLEAEVREVIKEDWSASHTYDAEWNEGDHPRRDNGEFGKGSGGKSGKSDYAKAREAEHDDRRDAAYAKKQAEIKQLLAHLAKAPKEDHASIKKELKQLGWKEPPKAEKPKPEPKPKKEPAAEKKAAPKGGGKRPAVDPAEVARGINRLRKQIERAEHEKERRT